MLKRLMIDDDNDNNDGDDFDVYTTTSKKVSAI